MYQLLINIIYIVLACLSIKYLYHSNIWIEYSPFSHYRNQQMIKEILNGLNKHSTSEKLVSSPINVSHLNLPPSHFNSDGEINNFLKEKISSIIDSNYLPNSSAVFSLNENINSSQLKILYVKENNQFFLLTDILLGEGHFGKTFLGVNPITNQWVAIKKSNLKIYSPDISDQITLTSSVLEYNTLMENLYLLKNKLLIGMIVKKDKNKKNIYSIMPYFHSIAINLLSDNQKLRLAIKLAESIIRLHTQGFSHNDLHIKNFCWDGLNCHLIDFGSMTQLDKWFERYLYITQSYTNTLSPEGLIGVNTEAKDTFAYGKILYQLLSESAHCEYTNPIANQLNHSICFYREKLHHAKAKLEKYEASLDSNQLKFH